LSENDKPITNVDMKEPMKLSKKIHNDADIIEKMFLGTHYKPAERDYIIKLMEEKGLFPTDWTHKREFDSGLYPDISDPLFSQRIYDKQEFYEARAAAISALEGTDPCNASVENVFEISPIQRLISRFLNPATPYNGLLLYHGVGVGKTCTAIRVAEEFLKVAPYSKVFIIVPQAIRAGFVRTTFDPSRLKKKDDGSWSSEQCTGMIYPDLAIQKLMKKAKPDAEFSVEDISEAADEKIRERYDRRGYLQFAYWIARQLKEGIPSQMTGAVREKAENNLLSKLFSDKLIIIDEAHNLRDAIGGFSSQTTAPIIAPVAEDEKDPSNSSEDHAGGKLLTPLLRRIVKYAEGLRLLLMTATPMYNKASEIKDLLELLIVNDTKDDSPKNLIGDIFTKDGNIKEGSGGDILIKKYSQRYVSYMRGENPYTFPLRLRPGSIDKAIKWPEIQKIGDNEKTIELTVEDQHILNSLPIVQITPEKGSVIYNKLQIILKEDIDEDNFKGDTWVHLDVCNIVYPNELYGHKGWDSYFTDGKSSGDGLQYRSFTWKGEEDYKHVDDIFGMPNFKNFAPKMAKIVDTVQKSEGINFIYSRYVKAGILPIAIALERQGWTRVFNNTSAKPIFNIGKTAKVTRQCAFCERKEDNHKDIKAHAFTPACYVLLTGDVMYTPNFSDILNYASRWTKTDKEFCAGGGRVKAILGSQITTEGLDLKCVRSVHVLEPWYHLNRIEQIIGRAVRFCSHADLPMNLRNCLVYLYALVLSRVETPDLHAYRISAIKAKAIGYIQRLMKISAMDCNINIAGLLIRDIGEGLPKRNIIDSERRHTSKYPLVDNSYSSTCDYLKDCDYTCVPEAKKDGDKNNKTFSYADAQKRIIEKEGRLKELFSKHDIAYPLEEIRRTIYNDLPWEIVSRSLVQILENPTFRIKRSDNIEGRLILQNGYLLFQPVGVRAKQIPLAYRYSRLYKMLPRTTIIPRRGSLLGLKIEEVDNKKESEKDIQSVEDPIITFKSWIQSVDALIKDIKERGFEAIKKREMGISKKAYLAIQAWPWIIYHFRDIPEIRNIAAQVWTELVWTAEDRKNVIEKILIEGLETVRKKEKDLVEALEKDIFITEKITGFNWINPYEKPPKMESFCLQNGKFDLCPSNYKETINKKIGPPINIAKDAGDLIGFLVPRKDKIIIVKTLQIDKKKSSTKIKGAVGSQCGVASDLGGARGRVKSVQDLIIDIAPELKKYLVDTTDTAEARDEEGRQTRLDNLEFKHVDDFSHIFVCMFLETLIRIMDARKCGGKRWFLNAVEAFRAELIGR